MEPKTPKLAQGEMQAVGIQQPAVLAEDQDDEVTVSIQTTPFASHGFQQAAASKATLEAQPLLPSNSGTAGKVLSSADGLAAVVPMGRQNWGCLSGLARRVSALTSTVWGSGAAVVAVASLLFALAGLQVKLLGGRVPVLEIVAWRAGISFLLCAMSAQLARPRITPLFGHRPQLLLLLGRGCFGAASMTTYYASLDMLPLADASTIFFLNPATTAVAAWAILGEPLGLKGAAGVLLSLVGLLLLTQPPFIFGGAAWNMRRVWGTSFGVASALLATCAFIFIRLIGRREEALVLSVYFNSASFFSGFLPLMAGWPHTPVMPRPLDFTILMGISACSFGAQVLIGRGFQLLTAAKASAYNFLQVLYGYAFGMMFLHESFTLLGAAGSALIAAGVILVNLRAKVTVMKAHLPGSTAGVELATARSSSISTNGPVPARDPTTGSPGATAATCTRASADVPAERRYRTFESVMAACSSMDGWPSRSFPHSPEVLAVDEVEAGAHVAAAVEQTVDMESGKVDAVVMVPGGVVGSGLCSGAGVEGEHRTVFKLVSGTREAALHSTQAAPLYSACVDVDQCSAGHAVGEEGQSAVMQAGSFSAQQDQAMCCEEQLLLLDTHALKNVVVQ